MRIQQIERNMSGQFIRTWARHRIFVFCLVCKNKIETVESRILDGKAKYCSRDCRFKAGVSLETRKLMSEKRKGINVSPETQFKKGQLAWNKGIKYPNKSKGVPRPQLRGANHPNWKGGQKRYKHLTSTVEYKNWRQAVFNRDSYTCRNCGIIGAKFEAHHIKSWAKFPELRYFLENGLTLCIPCHQKTDNYKGKK